MAFIYHERQLGGLCGVHCLNNLLQGPHFGPGDLAEIGVQLDQQERALLHEAGGDGSPAPNGAGDSPDPGGSGGAPSAPSGGGLEGQAYNVDASADGGNFSIQVLVVGLQKFGLQLLPAKHPQGRHLMQDPDTACEAFLCQCRDHWFAVRKVADCWWNLNSTRKRPAMVGPFYLAAWLAQLSAEGFSIFLLLGNRMPDPLKPHDPEKPEENFHDLFDLLEEAKASGGNPLAGGGDDVDDGDARAARDLQAEEDVRTIVALQREFGDESAHGEGYHGAGMGRQGGLYDEMLAAQMRLRASPARQAHHGNEVVEYPAQYVGRQSRGREPAAPDNGGILQALVGALQGCPCQLCIPEAFEEGDQGTAQAVAPGSLSMASSQAYPSVSSSAKSPSPATARRRSPATSSTAAFQAGSSSSSRSPLAGTSRSGHDAPLPPLPPEQALRDMGFKEPLVLLAQALSRSSRRSATVFQLLLQEPGVEPQAEADPERLARAVQQAVLACDTPLEAAFVERLVHVVAVLSTDEAKLRLAQEHFSAKALLEFLQSVLRLRGQGWSEDALEGAALAVHLLEARRASPAPEAVQRHSGGPDVRFMHL